MKSKQISDEHQQVLTRLRNDVKRALAEAAKATDNTAYEAKEEEIGRALEAATASFNKGNLDNLERMGSLQFQLQMVREKKEERTEHARESSLPLKAAMNAAVSVYRDVVAMTCLPPLHEEAFKVLSPLYFHSGHGHMEAKSMPVCMAASNFLSNLTIYIDGSYDPITYAPDLITLLDGVIAGKNPFHSLHAVIRGEDPGEPVPGLNLPASAFPKQTSRSTEKG
jgi:hypothetical protein